MIKDRSTEAYLKRKKRVRKKIRGTAIRPRLSVYRSAKHIYAQVIDDQSGRTLASASSVDKQLRGQLEDLKKAAVAEKVGELVAERCISKNIDKVVFDRNGFVYHGRVGRLADAARAKGLSF